MATKSSARKLIHVYKGFNIRLVTCDSESERTMITMSVVSRRLLSFLSCLLFIMISQACAQQPSYEYNVCDNDRGNYTANSTYHANLNFLLSSLISNTEIDYGFYNSSYGQNADKVYALGMCRPDLTPDRCRSCLNESRVDLTHRCPNQKEAIVWYDTSMLRYSNRSIFGIMETSPTLYIRNVNNATDVDQFNQVLRDLMDRLITTAIAGDSRRKYAAGNVRGPGFQYIYGLVQCTPDLSGLDCDRCLAEAVSEIPNCCDGKMGGSIAKPSCNVRFENLPYFEPTADAPPHHRCYRHHLPHLRLLALPHKVWVLVSW